MEQRFDISDGPQRYGFAESESFQGPFRRNDQGVGPLESQFSLGKATETNDKIIPAEEMMEDPKAAAPKWVSQHALAKAAEVNGLLLSDLRQHHSIAKLARKVGTNSRTLQEAFKQLYGKTIFDYGRDLRLEHGRMLLAKKDLTIQEIAEACGYPEQSNFSAAFKRKFGEAPGGWRKGGF